MDAPSLRKITLYLAATFLVCMVLSFIRHLLALNGVAFYPVRYIMILLGTGLSLGCVIAIVWLLRPPGRTWILLLGAGLTFFGLQIFSLNDSGSIVLAPQDIQTHQYYRLVFGPLADGAMYLIAIVLAYHFAQGAISVRLAQQRAIEQERAEQQLRDKQQFLEQLLDSHERDRQLIAYEVHDGFVQSLTGALMHMEAGQYKQGTMNPDAKQECERATSLVRESIDEARRLISGLRPPILDEQGTIAAIDYLIEEHRMSGGPPVDFQYDEDCERLSPLIQGVVFRLTQEALTNIRRHAEAQHVEINIHEANERIRLSIHDDGRGFNPDETPKKSFGLRGMKERAEAVHGKFDIDSKLGEGTLISIELPRLDATQLEARRRRKAEQALYESELRLQAVLDNTTAVIYQKDVEGRYQLLNNRYQELFNVNQKDLIGKTDFEVFPRDAALAFRENDLQVLKAGKPVEFEETAPQDDGVHTYISIKFPLFNAEGEPYAVCGISTDITERKRAEEALKNAHDDLERRVRKRTADLSSANEQLAREVEERKRVEMELRVSQSRLREQMSVLMRLNSGQTFGRGELSATLAEITEAASETLDCRRVNIWLFDDTRSHLHCIEHFDQESNDHEVGFELTADECPNYFAAISQERTIAAHDAINDPRTSEFAEGYLVKHNITSMLDAAIHLHGELVGLVCHEHVGPPRHWTIEEQNFGGSVADFVALALDADKLQRTESALRTSERQFRRAFADGPLGMSFVSPEGRILDSNHTLSRMLGYTKEELRDRRMSELLHPDDAEEDRRNTSHQFSGDRPVFTVEQRFLTKQQEVIWVRHTASLLEQLEADEPPVQLSMFEDITEHRHALEELQSAREELEARVEQRTADLTEANESLAAEIAERRAAEEGLRKSEYRFRSLIANAPAGVFLTNAESGECTYINKALQRMSGLPEAEALEHGWQKVIHEEDRDWVISKIIETGRKRQIFDEVFRIRLNDETVKFLHVNSAPLRTGENESTENIGMVLDVTEQKLVEERLAFSESRYRALLTAVPDLIVRLNRDGTCLDYFPGDTFLTRQPPEAYIGKNIFEQVPKDIIDVCKIAVERALEADDTYTETISVHDEPEPRRYEVRMRASGADEVMAIVRDLSQPIDNPPNGSSQRIKNAESR